SAPHPNSHIHRRPHRSPSFRPALIFRREIPRQTHQRRRHFPFLLQRRRPSKRLEKISPLLHPHPRRRPAKMSFLRPHLRTEFPRSIHQRLSRQPQPPRRIPLRRILRIERKKSPFPIPVIIRQLRLRFCPIPRPDRPLHFLQSRKLQI